MSRSDANFRNTASRGLVELKRTLQRGEVGNLPKIGAFPPFLELTCGASTEGDLVSWGIKSFYRTDSLLTNQRYYARECHLRIDDPGIVEISCTGEFDAHVTLVRSSTKKWTSRDGVIVADITVDDTGPFTVEVSSVATYTTGHFTIHVTCGETDVDTVVRISAFQYFDYATQRTMSEADFITAWTALRSAVNAFDMTTLDLDFDHYFEYDGVTLTFKSKAALTSDVFDGVIPGVGGQQFKGVGGGMYARTTNKTPIGGGLYSYENEYYLTVQRAVRRFSKAKLHNYIKTYASHPVWSYSDYTTEPNRLDTYLDAGGFRTKLFPIVGGYSAFSNEPILVVELESIANSSTTYDIQLAEQDYYPFEPYYPTVPSFDLSRDTLGADTETRSESAIHNWGYWKLIA